jgi:hypothetical protein
MQGSIVEFTVAQSSLIKFEGNVQCCEVITF